jgi:hypothetical protein
VRARVCVRARVWVLAAALVAACGDGDGPGAIDAGEPSRRISLSGIGFDERGISEPVSFAVPPGTRSITVVARGDQDALYALAWLQPPGGSDLVGLPELEDLGEAMRAQYEDEEIGQMPGALHQSIRLGMFTHVHPNRPGPELTSGEAVLRIATSDPAAGPVDLELFMPADDGGRTLLVNVFAVSEELTYDPADPSALPFLPALEAILAGADLTVRVDQIVNLPGTGLSSMTELSEPQEPPGSMSSQLALLAGAMVDGEALNLFVVDSLPFGVAGWSLGTPGPPMAGTYYSGVIAARRVDGGELGRVLAHEIAHFIGLSHVVNIGVSGARYPDPLDDTEPGTGNLMEGGGTYLTPDQAFVLSRYPLLMVGDRAR